MFIVEVHNYKTKCLVGGFEEWLQFHVYYWKAADEAKKVQNHSVSQHNGVFVCVCV